MTTSVTRTLRPATKRLRIDVWSDLGCPWCYLGKARLDAAVAASGRADAIDLAFHSFELDRSTPREPRPLLDYLSARMGVSPTEAAHMESRVADLAAAEGLPYTSERMHANSFDVHRILQFAATTGRGGALLGVLQRQLFGGTANVYAPGPLIEAAASVGLSGERVAEILAGDDYAAEVRRDEKTAAELGISGVPFAVLAGSIGIPGATSTDNYTNAIAQAWDIIDAE